MQQKTLFAALSVAAALFPVPSFAVVGTEPSAALAVRGVDSSRSSAIADGNFSDGWSWMLHLAVPKNERAIALKFGNFISGSSTIPVRGNVRYYSPDSVNAFDAAHAIAPESNDYGEELRLPPPRSVSQNNTYLVDVVVEAKVQKGAASGTYALSYGVRSRDVDPPIISISYSTTSPSHENVIATPFADEPVIWSSSAHDFAENGSFDFVGTDMAGNIATVTATVLNVDKVAPLISLQGSNPFILERGRPYVEPGMSATDDSGVDIVPTVDISRLDVNTSGKYLVLYRATDPAGNLATGTREVDVVDTTSPSITISYSTTSPTNQNVIARASMDEPGTLNATSTTFSGNGSFEFVAIDLAGNKTTKTATVANIDNIPPAIALVGSSTIYWERARPYVDPGATASDDSGALVSPRLDSSALDVNAVGTSSVAWTASDPAGNSVTVVRMVVVRDTTTPTISLCFSTTSPTVNDVLVSARINENTSTSSALSYLFHDNGSFVFFATDPYGNSAFATATVKNIDRDPPVISLKGTNPFYVERMQPYVDPGITTTDASAIAVTAMPVSMSTTATSTTQVLYTATDAAGNTATATRLVIVRDTTPPVITIEPYATSATNQSIIVWADVNEGFIAYGGYTGREKRTFNVNGTWNVNAQDDSGNTSTYQVKIVNIDKTPPLLSLIDVGTSTLEVGQAFSPGDWATATDTGKDHVGGAPMIFSSAPATMTNMPGIFSVDFWATDDAGNRSATSTKGFIVMATTTATSTISN